jgi:carbonic anhydrase
MQFCTVINCMDGRVQLSVIKYLQKRFNAKYVDSITEAGPNLILSKREDDVLVKAILDRLKISVEKHNSVGIAIVGHYDCAGNPASKDDQIIHIQKAMHFLRQHYEDMKIIGLWVDENWDVSEVDENK